MLTLMSYEFAQKYDMIEKTDEEANTVKQAPQKIKLLLLWQLLQQESDEEHPIRTRELLHYLGQRGINCDRRTLAQDVADLNSWGFEVMSVLCGHEKGYYVSDRRFSVPELRILMDAVQASDFITEKKTEDLTDKIAAMGGSHRATLLKRNVTRYNDHKRSNESVYYIIDTIEEALSQEHKVSFYYFTLDENRQKHYHREKIRYVVEPVGLVLARDRYYLTAISPFREGLSVYRIDRMEDVRMEPEASSPQARMLRSIVADYVGQSFKMFSGENRWVTLQFSRELIATIFDRFGEKTQIDRISEEECTATVPVQTSPTFWGWLFQFGDKMRIIDPPDAVADAIRFVAKLPYPKEGQA